MGQQALSELRAGPPLRVRDVTIVPLERLHVTVRAEGRRVFAVGGKHAAGVVLIDAGGARAIDETGRPLDLGDVVKRAVGLREML